MPETTSPEKYDRGPLRTYEVTWTNGHIETMQGHSVMLPSAMPDYGALFGAPATNPRRNRVTIHGEIDGQWTCVLFTNEDQIAAIRDVTGLVMTPDGWRPKAADA